MQEYYELSNAIGNSNYYYVSNPSQQISSAVQDLLIRECMISQVSDILLGHINLNNYINTILPNLENVYMHDLLDKYLHDTKINVDILKILVSDPQYDLIANSNFSKEVSKSWKQDLSYARSIQIMSGFVLNFYVPVENLSKKLRSNDITHVITKLHESTQILHETITQISIQLINNKFIN